MKSYKIICLIFLSSTSILFAQDGWILKAAPPISTRFEPQARNPAAYGGTEPLIYFTNTSDKIIHTVTLLKSDDPKFSRVIIDTIEPHKTIGVKLTPDVLQANKIVCKDYSKPNDFSWNK